MERTVTAEGGREKDGECGRRTEKDGECEGR